MSVGPFATRKETLAWLNSIKHVTSHEAETALALLGALKADEWDMLVNRVTQPWRRRADDGTLALRRRKGK